MATILTHGLVGLGLGYVFTRRRLPPRFWVLTAVLPIVPDFDVAAFAFGIPYEAFLGHRGFSHSLCFAFLSGFAAAALTYRRLEVPFLDLGGFFFLVVATHGLLDALTNGGLGVAFFSPVDTARYFFPWQPIEVSPIGPSFFSATGLRVLKSEALWVWLPLAALVGGVSLWRRFVV